MNSTEFSCPGKVFILGEYACLKGTPALVGAIEPSFRLTLMQKNNGGLPFHSNSPAGKLYFENENLFKNYKLEWHDPYKTPIGVGSSTAQFLLVLKALCFLQKKTLPLPQDMLTLYWSYCTSTLRPSGCDLMAQVLGGIHVVKNSPFKIKEYKPLENVSWLLAYTGEKIKTHEQLEELHKKGFPLKYEMALKELDHIILHGLQDWETRSSVAFGKSLNQFHDSLHEKIVTSSFTEHIRAIQKWPGVLGCKGSGAQGGDCILVLTRPEEGSKISDKLERTYGWITLTIQWHMPRL